MTQSLYQVNLQQAIGIVDKYESYYAYVLRETTTGCILSLQLENGETTPGFAFGNFDVGDYVIVTVGKVFDDGRFPRVSVDTVISYASNEKTHDFTRAA